jgi:phosphate transport system substrate-binding protein
MTSFRLSRAGAGAMLAGLLLAAAACSSSATSSANTTGGTFSGALNGAGSTFAAPMYQQWAGLYRQHGGSGMQINYQAIGSGGGISEFSQAVVDFGATDAPMSQTEQSAAQAGQGSVVLHIPMILGDVAVIYNEPSVSGLKLDGATLAKIYLGTITKWNDKAIAALNPGVALPSDAIQPTQRADSSGTSYVFTSYLSAVSPDWQSQVGVSKAPTWPTGTGATGSSGMAAAVQQAKGAIGYVELGYAIQGHIPFAAIKNGGGEFVSPSTAATLAAATAASYPSDPTALTFSLVNSAASGAYPLSTPTYILVAQQSRNAAAGRALKAWLLWALASAQQSGVAQLGYTPLPPALDRLAIAAVGTMH